MKLLLTFVVCLSPLLVGGSATIQNGHTIYLDRCRFCHGILGDGNPTYFKAMGKDVLDLRSEQVQSLSNAQMHDRIVKGGKDQDGKMPAFEVLDQQQVADLIAFIRSLKLTK